MENTVKKLDSGFAYSCVLMGEYVMVAIVDERVKGSTSPVAMVANVPVEAVDSLVSRAIHLYRDHQIISLAGSADEFNDTFLCCIRM